MPLHLLKVNDDCFAAIENSYARELTNTSATVEAA